MEQQVDREELLTNLKRARALHFYVKKLLKRAYATEEDAETIRNLEEKLAERQYNLDVAFELAQPYFFKHRLASATKADVVDKLKPKLSYGDIVPQFIVSFN